MSILIDENTTFIIQGITGREAFSDRTMNGAAWGQHRMPQPCLPRQRRAGGRQVFKLGWS